MNIKYISNHRAYQFTGSRIYPAGNENYGKTIFKGKFIGESPHDCIRAGQECILIRLEISGRTQAGDALPQNRQYWDAAYIGGENLRQVLGRDDAATRLADHLAAGIEPAHGVYQFIEPVYTPVQDLLPSMSVHDRLDFIIQTLNGLKTLYRFRVGSGHVIAHRDLKLTNLMLELHKNGFTVRIIDLASLCTSAGSGTIHTLVSPPNSAPEIVGAMEASGFRVSDRTDLFSLGGILAELLGGVNPISEWVSSQWPSGGSAADAATRLRDAYEQVYQRYRTIPAGVSWLEKELKFSLNWDSEIPADLHRELQLLFCKMTAINPVERPSLADVEVKIRKILRRMTPNSRSSMRRDDESICLIDQRELHRNRKAYLASIFDFWEDAPLICVCGAVDAAIVSDDALRRNCLTQRFQTPRELEGALEVLSDARGSKSLMVSALNALNIQTGTVHILTPLASALGDDLAETAAQLHSQGVQVIIHCNDAPSEELLRHVEYAQLKEHRKKAEYVSPEGIYTGEGAWYLTCGDTKIYVGKKV